MTARKPIIPPGVTPNPALSPGLQVGDTLYVSGQIAVDASGNLVGAGDCEAQTRQVMANVRAVVEAAGASMEDVVKTTGFLTDAADFPLTTGCAWRHSQRAPSQFHRHSGRTGASGVTGGGGSGGTSAAIRGLKERFGRSGRIRTPDHWFWRPALYQAELRSCGRLLVRWRS